jgi:hypothetical protein
MTPADPDPVQAALWDFVDPPRNDEAHRGHGAAHELRRGKRPTRRQPDDGPAPAGDAPTGEALRDEGVDQALNAADTRARLAGEDAIRRLAELGGPFTAEDVRELVGAPLGARPNLLPALFRQAARRGEIVAVGYRPASRPEARQRVLRVWRGAA